jgi:hypothetical protein|tara:strand:+ start:531 stop:884 length:354 start_codon:yes stop_codon:yes gene_type:complete
MAISYSWQFYAIDLELGPDAEDHTDIVYTVHWRYNADDGDGHTAQNIGTSSIVWEEGDSWIEYADLTESDVEGWVEEQIGEDELAEMKLRLDANIEEQVSPTRETNRTMPWDEDNGA